MKRYLALDLPAPVRNLKIAEDLDLQIRQRDLIYYGDRDAAEEYAKAL